METYVTKRGETRYKEKVRLSDKTLITKTFRRKRDAELWKMKVETEKAQGVIGIHSLKPISFREVAQKWFESKVQHSLAYKSVLTYRYTLEAKVLPELGHLNVDKVTLSHIDAIKSRSLRSGLKAKTINRLLTMIRQILLFAQDEGHLKDLPFKRSLLLRSEKLRFNYFEASEVKALLIENRSTGAYPILYLALHTGMRLGEILGLCWDRVNFGSGRIEITRTLHRKGNLQEKTKSGKARYFPMNEELRAFFMDLRRTQTTPTFVFVNKNGEAFNPDHFSGRNFKRACKRARVRSLRFHDLRHTFASHFMMNGGNLFDLKELLGHSDIKTTMVYAHLSPDHLKEASRIVNFGIHFGQEKAAGPSLALAESGT